MASSTRALHTQHQAGNWGRGAAFVALASALLFLLFLVLKPLRVLPYLTPSPSYNLIDQHGQPVSAADLRGKVVLYNFIYTHCTTVCPAMTGQMLQIQRQLDQAGWLGQDVVLVTITFDPERDTPDRLREYAARMQASPEGWLWLTGEPVAIRRLVGGEFGVYFEPVPLDEAAADAAGLSPEERAAGYDFIHAAVFVLVDETGQIRAEYQQMLDLDQAVRDIALVVREKNASPLAQPLWQAAHLIRAYP